MSRILVDNPVTEQFAMIPNAVWELDCSVKAKALLGYLLSFHHMAAPTVAQIESVLRIGKKARLSAMGELVELGLIRWQYDHDKTGRIVGQTLCVTSRPLLVGVVEKEPKHRKRQKGAIGTESAISPLSVKRTRDGAKKAPGRGQKGATKVQYKDKDKEPAALNLDFESLVSGLSPFQRSRLLNHQGALIDGELVKPSDALAVRLRELLREIEGA